MTDLVDVNLSKPWEVVEDRGPWCAAGKGHTVGRDVATGHQQR